MTIEKPRVARNDAGQGDRLKGADRMGSMPQPAREYRQPDDVQRHELRAALMARYRADQTRYQMIVQQDLRPLWRAVIRAQPHLDVQGVPPVFALLILNVAAAEGDDPGGHIARYYRKLGIVARDSLRLRVNDFAADWALPFVHGDVARIAPQAFVPPHGPDSAFPWFSADLRMTATPYMAGLACQTMDDSTVERPTVSGTVTINDQEASVLDWEAFRDLAHACLDLAINQARAHSEASVPNRRPSARKRHDDDLDRLFDHLFHGRRVPEDAAIRLRLRRISHQLGIDFPVAQ